jgi:hypothetical protein
MMQRLLRDKRILSSNPKRIRNQVLRKSIMFMQAETMDIKDKDEKAEAMLTMAQEAYEGIAEAIDELEKDMDYRPKKLLGFEMYPGRIYSLITTIATLSFGILQSRLDL